MAGVPKYQVLRRERNVENNPQKESLHYQGDHSPKWGAQFSLGRERAATQY
jgi:hypothetical protein